VKNPVSPGVFIGVIAALVVIAAAVMFWVWRSPSAPVAQGASEESSSASAGGGPQGQAGRAASMMADMKAAHQGPTSSERQAKEEWKKTHPDGYTR